ARKLVSSDSLRALAGESQETFCSYMEEGMDFEDLGEGAEGECTCSGTIQDTIDLQCSFTNICDDLEEYCGDISFGITMSNLLDEEGELSDEATLDIKACVDVDVTWLEEICFTMTYAGLVLDVPTSCSVTYDGQLCSCTIDTVDIEGGTFDMEVPCVMWSCQEVVPALLKPYMVQDTCNAPSTMDEEAGPANPAVASLNSLEQIPEEVAKELEADAAENGGSGGSGGAGGSGAMSMGMTGAMAALIAITGLLFA
ncbi:MAG: hypothetical protein SGARI_004265, partial [Bacillariaceae sp.]